MRAKSKFKSFISLLPLVFLGIVCSSCAVRSENVRPNVKNFAQVNVSVDLKLEICDEKNNCKSESPGTRNALGSGTFFTYKNKKAFLTAGHVCLGPAYQIWDQIPKNSEVKIKIILSRYTGENIGAKIYYVNLEYDICILDVESSELSDLPKVSNRKQRLHEKLYSIQAPFSIYHTAMVPVFEGRYVGDQKKFAFFTMPAGPGGSGGPIYNSKNKIVGVVQRTHMHFPHVALSIKHEDFIRILERYHNLKKQGITQLIE